MAIVTTWKQKVKLALALAVWVACALALNAQSVSGTLSSSVTQQHGTIDGCPNVWETIWTWTFTDPSGGKHPFPGATQYLYRKGARGTPCIPPTTTAMSEWSADGLYYLEATGGSGEVPNAEAFFSPQYKVVSILYDPPGNQSSAGLTNSISVGATTTVGSSFSDGQSITFTYGFGPLASGSLTFGESQSTSSSDSFTDTFSDAAGTSLSNTNTSNAINHGFDTFLIWLNPEVTVFTNGVSPVSYSVGVEPLPDGTVPNPDVVKIAANVMEANGAGATTVPATWLNHQVNPATGEQTPGLASICKNLNTAEYAANTCTLADQCGCKPSDFAPILALDPLLHLSSTASPLSVDTSGSLACDEPTAATKCRYVPVPVAPGSPNQVVVTLSGPDALGDPASCNNFTQTNSTSTSQTLGESTTESVSTSFHAGPSIGLSLTTENTLSWTQNESTGSNAGSGYSESVNLCSSTVGCGQNIPLYQDTTYHTFVFQQPPNNNSCP